MFGYSVGSLFGPIIAGLLSDEYGYDRSFSLLGMMLLLSAICFLPLIFIDIESAQ